MSKQRRAKKQPLWVRPPARQAPVEPPTEQARIGPAIEQETSEIPTERVQIKNRVHRADWPRRAKLVNAFDKRVAEARTTEQWPGMPIRVRRHGDDYVLVSGFSRLAIALEAGLPTARAIVEPDPEDILLAEIHLTPQYKEVRLRPKKLTQRREVLQSSGSLDIPLYVRPAQEGEPSGYMLQDGLYWYHLALEMGMEKVPVIIQR